jgi:parallel beta-helix repeat protein
MKTPFVCASPVSLTVAGLLVAFGLGGGFAAEDPPGPPGSPQAQMKTLNEIEPRTVISSLPYIITNRGSYYLTQNLVVPPATNGIMIGAHDVTLDLNGYGLIGRTNSWSGISLASFTTKYMNLTVRNGVVSGWGGCGVALQDGINCRLVGVSAISNGWLSGSGIYVGRDWQMEDCLALGNRSVGISAGDYCRVRNCRARDNVGNGFHWGTGTVIEDCLAVGNQQAGFFGTTLSVIRNCLSLSNVGDGVYVGPNSIAEGNLAGDNGGNGFWAGAGSRLERNLASGNDQDGIRAGSYSLVDRNQSVSNLKAGIRGSWYSRIEGNHVAGNSVGLDADGSRDNLYLSNSAIGNTTNFIAVPGAYFGSLAGPAVLNGNSTNFPFANPWGNFGL